jgi:hypothetical protein
MKYYFLATVKIDPHPWFIQICKYQELQAHPNVTDVILVDDLHCSIDEILHVVNDDNIWVKLLVEDPIPIVENSEEAIKILIEYREEYIGYGWKVSEYDLGEL